MSQTRKGSAFEAIVNIVVGYVVAVIATQILFPLYGIPVEFEKNLIISGFFTIISLVRSYALRRIFNGYSGVKNVV